MAIPKRLTHINYGTAQTTIAKHLKANTGWWEGTPDCSDFVYEIGGGRRKLIRPGFSDDDWETGIVVM